MLQADRSPLPHLKGAWQEGALLEAVKQAELRAMSKLYKNFAEGGKGPFH